MLGMESWLRRVLAREADSERELLEHFSRRLMELARRQLPIRVQRRVDPEDVVQSVYRSFFRRLEGGEFRFEESHDVWRLLAAMTFRKARLASRFHQRQRRDVKRETRLTESTLSGISQAATPAEGFEPQPSDVVAMFELTELILAKLQSYQRDVFTLRLEGYSVEEIARKVERSESTVFRVLARVQDIADELLKESL